MVGNKVPQELVTEVGEAFKSIMDEANQVRAENSEDMSVSRAISVVFERRPDLRLDGLPHKVLQWSLCRIEGRAASWWAWNFNFNAACSRGPKDCGINTISQETNQMVRTLAKRLH